jgi:PHD/YefM family antitoxin component YafN of YafNO toxin-antitoxin module
MVSYGSNELVASSELAKKFGSYLAQLKDHSLEKLAVLKNNKVEAVMLDKDEYESMLETLKTVEARQILASIQAGLEDVQAGRTYPIDTLWEELSD